MPFRDLPDEGHEIRLWQEIAAPGSKVDPREDKLAITGLGD
jgi:hypothetical protein